QHLLQSAAVVSLTPGLEQSGAGSLFTITSYEGQTVRLAGTWPPVTGGRRIVVRIAAGRTATFVHHAHRTAGKRPFGGSSQLCFIGGVAAVARGGERVFVVIGKTRRIEPCGNRPGIATVEHLDDCLIAAGQACPGSGPADFK